MSPRSPAAILYDSFGHELLGSQSPAVDPFGRLRISEPYTYFDTTHQYDNSPLFWDTIVSGTGAISHVANQSAVQLTTGGTASGASVKFQTHNYMRYQPGKALLVLMTGLLGSPTVNVVRRCGYYDDQNGAFFEVNANGLVVTRRTNTSGSVVDNQTTQANFNVDKLDGTGPSGVTIDLTKVQLFFIDLQWLSIGIIRWGIEFDGRPIICHIGDHSNILTTPYMTTANLPVRYEITNTGTASGTNTLLAICSVAISEGGQDLFGIPFGVNTGTTSLSVSSARVPLLSIRPALTFQSVANRGLMQPTSFDMAADQLVVVEVFLNPTLTGASWAAVNATHSIAEMDTSASAISGGVCVYSALGGGAAKILTASAQDLNLSKRLLSLNAAGTVGDILTITVSKISTNTTTTSASINWLEFR